MNYKKQYKFHLKFKIVKEDDGMSLGLYLGQSAGCDIVHVQLHGLRVETMKHVAQTSVQRPVKYYLRTSNFICNPTLEMYFIGAFLLHIHAYL